jgi:hypothetical protein
MRRAITIKHADIPYSLTPRDSEEAADSLYFWYLIMVLQVRILHKIWQDGVLVSGCMWDEIVVCEEVLSHHSLRKSRKITKLVTLLLGSENEFHYILYL